MSRFTANLTATLRDVATLLGGHLKQIDPSFPTTYIVLDAFTLTARYTDGDRFEFSYVPPKDSAGRQYHGDSLRREDTRDLVVRIGCAANKSPKQIAADITRRLLNDVKIIMGLYQEVINRAEARMVMTKENAAKLQALLDTKPHGASNVDSVTFYTYDIPGFYSARVESDTVTFSTSGMPFDKAIKLIEFWKTLA